MRPAVGGDSNTLWSLPYTGRKSLGCSELGDQTHKKASTCGNFPTAAAAMMDGNLRASRRHRFIIPRYFGEERKRQRNHRKGDDDPIVTRVVTGSELLWCCPSAGVGGTKTSHALILTSPLPSSSYAFTVLQCLRGLHCHCEFRVDV